MAIGDQSGHQVDQEVIDAAVTGMSDLRDVLQLVDYRFDKGPLTQHELVKQRQQTVLHVLAQAGNELHVLLEKLVSQGLRDVALVAEQLAKEAFGQMGYRLAVIDIAGRQVESQQLAAIVDDQMQFKAEEPAHRGLASGRQAVKHPVSLDSPVVTDRQRGGIDEGNASDRSQACFEIETQRPECLRHQFDKPGVADQMRKLARQVPLHVLGIVGLEIAIARHMEVDDDCHDLADGQTGFATGTIRPSQNRLWLLDGKHLAKIIDIDEEVQ